MDKYELRAILMSGSLMAVFFTALLFNLYDRKIDVPECTPYTGVFKEPHVTQLDKNTYQAFVTAGMWAFAPTGMKFPKGSTVDFYLTSKDVVHGFLIEHKGVNLMAIPGTMNKVTVKFNEPGEYRIVCHEYCGAGHQNMMSAIDVTE